MPTPHEIASAYNRQNPPAKAPKGTASDQWHGAIVADPYRSLENLSESSTRAWVDAEHMRFEGFLADQPGRAAREAFLKEIWKYPRESPRSRFGNLYVSVYYDGEHAQPVIRVRDSIDGPPRTLIDPNVLDPEGRISIGSFVPSPDGKLLAYTLTKAGSDYQTLYIIDMQTGRHLSDVIPDCRFTSIVWDRDSSQGFQYSYPADDGKKRHVLKYHRVGQPEIKDPIIFERADTPYSMLSPFYIRNEKGAWGTYDFVHSRVGTSPASQIYVRPKGTDAPYQLLFSDGKSSLYIVGEINGEFYAVTNRDARRGKLVAINPAQPQPENWRTVIPEHEQDVIKRCLPHQGKLLVAYRHDTAARWAVHALTGEHHHDLPLPPMNYATSAKIYPEDKTLYIESGGFRSPGDHYKYDWDSNKLELWQPTQSKTHLRDAIVERVMAPSKDGTPVPMTIIRKPGTKLDGTAAVKLYAYGGFGVEMPPRYSQDIYQWVNEGGIYVQANIRGGGEFGAHWHEQGRGRQKQNSYDDFIGCAETLIAKGYTQPQRLAIEGGSNGGLMTLAVVLQRPDLFGSVISHVPVTDMYRFPHHEYGTAWKAEYGDPQHAEDFAALSKYSPLHNIKPGQKYPPILVTTATGDNRVVPSHAYKFVATFQEHAHPDSLCLLRVERDAGHGQGKPTHKVIRSLVDNFTFLEKTLGPINQEKYKEMVSGHQVAAAKPTQVAALPPQLPVMPGFIATTKPNPNMVINIQVEPLKIEIDLGRS